MALNFDPQASIEDSSCTYPSSLSLQGALTWDGSAGNDGKAIHLVALDSIADLSVYSLELQIMEVVLMELNTYFLQYHYFLEKICF